MSPAKTRVPVRFVESGTFRAIWTDPVLVRCPACESCARVTRVGAGHRAACDTCGFAETSGAERGSRPWRGPVYLHAWKRCSHCGARIDQVLKAARAPVHPFRRLHCPGCGTMNVVPLRWYPAQWRATATDPFFGLPLWLQTSCAGKRLWAYNRAHVGILRRYVGAQLRERQPNVNMSWATKLPSWIKLAKHRERVLKSLDDLRDMLPG